MHPGDVRMLWACAVPELHSHKNVLLFSQHRVRPEPSKMAGSDLDGDEYAVTWDPRLFLGEWNQCTRCKDSYWSKTGWELQKIAIQDLQQVNHRPLAYDKLPKQPKNIRIEDKTLVEHLIQYAKNDNLGRIGMLWQDWGAKSGAKS
jgi:RNA dependent RNA polymerase